MKRPLSNTSAAAPPPKLPPPQKDIDDWFNDDEDEQVKVASQRKASQRIASQVTVQQSIQIQSASYIQKPLPQAQSSSSSIQAPVFKVPQLPPPRNTRPQTNSRTAAPPPLYANPRAAAAPSFQRQPTPQSNFRPAIPQSFPTRQSGPLSTLNNTRAPGILQQQQQRPQPRLQQQQQNIPHRPQAIQQHQQQQRLPTVQVNLPRTRSITTTSTGVQTDGYFQTSKLSPSKYQILHGQLVLMWQMRNDLKKPSIKFQDAFPKFNTFYDLKDSLS